jgi:uncharacterized protein YceH (UPF0502 family)
MIELTHLEARVIGSLIEKAITTPDQYPLSLNALLNACNQKSNRDPVMDLDERTVQDTLAGLAKKHLVLEKSGFGSRVPKHQHRFCNTGFGTLEFTPVETGIICELLLRGPQTPGELRTRVTRLTELADPNEVERALDALAARQDGPFVVRLPREPSRRDSRWAHLLSGPIDVEALGPAAEDDESETSLASASRGPSNADRITSLEATVAELQRELEELKKRLS